MDGFADLLARCMSYIHLLWQPMYKRLSDVPPEPSHSAPVAPDKPLAPVRPVDPVAPDTPVDPLYPVSPVLPVSHAR